MKASISPSSVASRRENRVPADKLCDPVRTMQAFKKHTRFRNLCQGTACLTIRYNGDIQSTWGMGLALGVSAKKVAGGQCNGV